MTSNIGAHLIQENMQDMTDENTENVLSRTRLEVFELLKKSLRPEFLNRIDEIIMFNPLTRDEIHEIVRIQFNAIRKMMGENEIELRMTDEAADWLGQIGYDPQFGARPLKRVIQKKILNELSKQILAGLVTKESTVEIDVDDKHNFIFRNAKTPAYFE